MAFLNIIFGVIIDTFACKFYEINILKRIKRLKIKNG